MMGLGMKSKYKVATHHLAITCLVILWFVFSTALGALEKAKTNSIGMQFVAIKEGQYRRGFKNADRRENQFHQTHPFSNAQNFKYEQPDHKVILTRSFDLGISEVTVGQFKEFVAATRFQTDAEKGSGALGFFPAKKGGQNGKRNREENYVDRFRVDPKVTWHTPGFEQTDEHPVVAVSRNDAVSFCEWLSRKEGVKYRLPTEAEWEYACRAGTETWYSWGKSPDDAYRHGNVADGKLESAHPNTTRFQRAVKLNQRDGDGVVFTAKVKSFRANPWGLYDMHGNVWEWCEDRWCEDVYKRYFDGLDYRQRQAFEIRDPVFTGNTDQHKYGDWRVIRGGAWNCAPAAVRSSI